MLNSPRLASSDFHLVRSLKEALSGIKFVNSDAVQTMNVHIF